MQNSNLNLKEIFDSIILKEAQRILDENSGLILVNNAFDLLHSEYQALHDYYLKKHMHSHSDGLDTHKELATIIIAILKVKMIKTIDGAYYESFGEISIEKHAFNETLAFYVSCDFLQTIISCDYDQNDKMSKEEKDFSKNAVKVFSLPHTTYQSYKQNVITEFYYTSREGNYNFLGLADKFFWLEYFNKRRIKQEYEKIKNW